MNAGVGDERKRPACKKEETRMNRNKAGRNERRRRKIEGKTGVQKRKREGAGDKAEN
ncbi:MAG: hypothetical protein ACLR23_25255 [Clostridia bacterium]